MKIKKEPMPIHIPSEDGLFRMQDYTFEYCPNCEKDVVIFSQGVTACPACGEPLAPCSMCETCSYDTCPYGCADNGVHIQVSVNNPPISTDEQGWFSIMEILRTARKEA